MIAGRSVSRVGAQNGSHGVALGGPGHCQRQGVSHGTVSAEGPLTRARLEEGLEVQARSLEGKPR